MGDTVEGVRQRVTGDNSMTDRTESDDFFARQLGVLSTSTKQGPFALLVELVADVEVKLMSSESAKAHFRESISLIMLTVARSSACFRLHHAQACPSRMLAQQIQVSK